MICFLIHLFFTAFTITFTSAIIEIRYTEDVNIFDRWNITKDPFNATQFTALSYDSTSQSKSRPILSLELQCTSNDPIHWIFRGAIESSETPLIDEIDYISSTSSSNYYMIKLYLKLELGTSVSIFCSRKRAEKLFNDSKNVYVNIFVPAVDRKILIYSPNISFKPNSQTVVVSCAVNDPKAPIKLLNEVYSTGIEKVVQNYSCNPTTGCELNYSGRIIWQRIKYYLCGISTSEFKQIKAFFDPSSFVPRPIYEIEITKDNISSLCSTLKNSFSNAFIYEWDNSNWPDGLKHKQPLFQYSDYFSQSDISQKSISIRSLERHLRLFCTKKEERGQIIFGEKVISILKLTLSENSKKFSHEKIDPSTLIHLDIIRSPLVDNETNVLYVNDTQNFTCKSTNNLDDSSSEFKSDNLLLVLCFKNSTKESFPGGKSTYCKVKTEKDGNGNVLSNSSCNLTLEFGSILCISPLHKYSQIYISKELKFETKYSYHPFINKATNSSFHFKDGEKNKFLNCDATGVPEPNITWKKIEKGKIIIFNQLDDFNSGNQYAISNGSQLLFNHVYNNIIGKYECEAKNNYGSDKINIIVHVGDRFFSEETTGLGVWEIMGIVLALLLLFLILFGVGFKIFFTRYKKQQELLRSLTQEEIDLFFKGDLRLIADQRILKQETLDFIAYDKDKEIGIDDTQFDYSKIIGTGEFAYVVLGYIPSKMKQVAIKIAKPSADVTKFKSLLTEVKVMMYIGKHENVVEFIGACTTQIVARQIYIFMEFCEIGSLEMFLRSKKRSFINLINENQEIQQKSSNFADRITTLELIKWAKEISSGMEFLAEKMVVHADLACRNVLLNAQLIAKISDFGLSRKLYESQNYVKNSKTVLPWRWMAVETLTTLTFSTKSDVWSYGVTLYEIFSLGDVPFAEEIWNKNFVHRLMNGMRMGRPKYSNQEIYAKMTSCWDENPEIRPEFSHLTIFFSCLLDNLDINKTGGESSQKHKNSGIEQNLNCSEFSNLTGLSVTNVNYMNDYSPIVINYSPLQVAYETENKQV